MEKILDKASLSTFQSHLTEDEVVRWFSKKLNRQPEPNDVYTVAKECYQSGEYAKAVQALELYAKMPGCQLEGIHLLGYSYYMVGEAKKAVEQFQICVHGAEEYESDWQLLVELTIENEEGERSASASSASSASSAASAATAGVEKGKMRAWTEN